MNPPPAATVMGPDRAPTGTVTTSEVLVAEITDALTWPNCTAFAAAMGTKLLPVMVAVVPYEPPAGIKPLMTAGELCWVNVTDGEIPLEPKLS